MQGKIYLQQFESNTKRKDMISSIQVSKSHIKRRSRYFHIIFQYPKKDKKRNKIDITNKVLCSLILNRKHRTYTMLSYLSILQHGKLYTKRQFQVGVTYSCIVNLRYLDVIHFYDACTSYLTILRHGTFYNTLV